MFLCEFNPLQLAYMSEILDKVPTVSQDKIQVHAQIRQQLSQPQLSEKVVAELKQQGFQEGFSQAQQQLAAQQPPPAPAIPTM
jgi:hypothetical protein